MSSNLTTPSAFHESLIARAATIDELLSDTFESLPGEMRDSDQAARRLAAWCRASAGGDWSLFARRLERDGLSIDRVLARLATVRRSAGAPIPRWAEDAAWVEAALQDAPGNVESGRHLNPLPAGGEREKKPPCPFEQLFAPIVEQAEARLIKDIGARALDRLNEAARADLRHALLEQLCDLAAPALYERFAAARKTATPARDGAAGHYDQFLADMRTGGTRRLFEDKPVLLRLIATLTRQWIDTAREFIMRLDADFADIGRAILGSQAPGRVAAIEDGLSDPHNGGRSVRIVTFEDGTRTVYKPKDLRVDVAWHGLVERLNRADPPIELRAARAIARDGYGWTEFVAHAGCAPEGVERFFRRAGAWLALFHCLAASDMHQENMIADGDHPVPIDLEMILQASAAERTSDPEKRAFAAADDSILDSVMMVGLLPAYGRSADRTIHALGGMTSGAKAKARHSWNNINSDTMRPVKSAEPGVRPINLPHVNGRYAKFGDHLDSFIAGFAEYADFLLRLTRDAQQGGILDGLAGLPVRKVIRPTEFYYMVGWRLRDHRRMGDGATWSAQADFSARLADWDNDRDPHWPLQRGERSALVALNVPHFTSPCDRRRIADAAGTATEAEVVPGLDRARARVRALDEREIAWQIEVIRQNTAAVSRSSGPAFATKMARTLSPDNGPPPQRDAFIAEADRIAAHLSDRAIRGGPGAAWIGLDWLGDSEVSQLVALGPDLYNGTSGIAVFLAAHAAVTGNRTSAELARAAVVLLRSDLRSRNAARYARSLGIGGATGLGSIVYALTVMAGLLHDDALRDDARLAASLFTNQLIAADRQLDVIGGSAGAILGLLRLYRDTSSSDVLARAIRCGEHLMGQPRVGQLGRRSWCGRGAGPIPLNGMSHGAAGYAYALAALAAASGRTDFAEAADECIVCENATYSGEHANWPDLREDGMGWLCQWCHGPPGIGLARIATCRRGRPSAQLMKDIGNALVGVERGWPGRNDTMCCGTLGSIEFFCAAGDALGRPDVAELAARRLMAVLETARASGDYLINAGGSRFNLSLFRGLAGVGYTCLRRADVALPNILVWE